MPSLRLGGTGTRGLSALAVVLATVVFPTGSATANLESWRWSTRTICVQVDAATSSWPVHTVARRYSASDDVSVVAADDCGDYQQKVWLSRYAAADGRCGLTTAWWDDHHRLRSARVQLNTFYWGCLSSPNRRAHVLSHELGHAVGIAHTDRQDSVMSVSTWSYDHVPYPTASDYQEIERRYPW